jgi:hypothetical protein
LDQIDMFVQKPSCRGSLKKWWKKWKTISNTVRVYKKKTIRQSSSSLLHWTLCLVRENAQDEIVHAAKTTCAHSPQDDLT